MLGYVTKLRNEDPGKPRKDRTRDLKQEDSFLLLSSPVPQFLVALTSFSPKAACPLPPTDRDGAIGSPSLASPTSRSKIYFLSGTFTPGKGPDQLACVHCVLLGQRDDRL